MAEAAAGGVGGVVVTAVVAAVAGAGASPVTWSICSAIVPTSKKADGARCLSRAAHVDFRHDLDTTRRCCYCGCHRWCC